MRPATGLAGAGVLLTIYASLHPLTGWRASGAGVFDFLFAAWPRYATGFDIATNIAIYVPLGFLLYSALRQALPSAIAFTAALIAGSLLSFSMEFLQNFLPSRVPSNLDLASNELGTLLGVLVALRWNPLLVTGGRIDYAWRRLAAEGRGLDSGVLVMGIWLLAQTNPHSLLFGAGELRPMLGLGPAQPFSAERFMLLETAVTATGLLAAALLAALFLRRHRRTAAYSLLLGGLLAKTAGIALIEGPTAALAWLTPGAGLGLAIGGVLVLVVAALKPSLQRALAALTLLLLTAMTNLMPDNPYLASGLPAFPAAQWLNFNGLTQLAGAIWPFVTLAWLMKLQTYE
jgi:VanZ family protein